MIDVALKKRAPRNSIGAWTFVLLNYCMRSRCVSMTEFPCLARMANGKVLPT